MKDDLEELINPLQDSFDKDDESRIFTEMAKIDGMAKYLRACMAQDMRLHFETDKNSQDLVRGAFFRTKHWAKLLKDCSVK